MEAEPPDNEKVPRVVLPSLKVTLPVAVLGVMLAVNVTACPNTGRVVSHSRQLLIRLSRHNPVYVIFLAIRQRLRDMQIANGVPNSA